jgi:hypothetical protein
MSDPDHSIVHEEALSGTLLRYLQRHKHKILEEVAARINVAFAGLRQELPGLQDKAITSSFQELARRIGALERRLDAHNEQHASQARAITRLNHYKRTRDRDEQGRLIDQLLIDVERRRVLLTLTQRQLAEILFVDFRRLNTWLARKVSPQMAVTRQKLEDWLKETEAEAVVLNKKLADELAEWM